VVEAVKMEQGGGGSQALMLGVCVGAIYAAYVTQGVVQENVWVSRTCELFWSCVGCGISRQWGYHVGVGSVWWVSFGASECSFFCGL
jgi:hypothetical protein